MITTALRLWLVGLPGIYELVGDRIYIATLPQAATLPAAVLNIVSMPMDNIENTPRNSLHTGRTTTERARVQIDTYADTLDSAWQVARIINSVLSGARGRMGQYKILAAFRENMRFNPVPDVDLMRLTADYTITYHGGI